MRTRTEGLGRGSWLAGLAAVAGMLPYLGLKILWVTGHPVGVLDHSVWNDSLLTTLNLATLGMEMVAVAVAVALTQPWGLRLPAWLVVFPVWVAAGLLGYRVLMMPVALLAHAGSSSGGNTSTALVESWVYLVASCGFVVQGIALLAAFVLHCRARWGSLLGSRTGRPQPATGASYGFQVVAVRACAGFAVILAALYGLQVVLRDSQDTRRLVLAGGYDLCWVICALLGALLLTGHNLRREPVRLWVPLTMVLAGTGAMVWWGIWTQINLINSSRLSTDDLGAYSTAQFGGVCIGLVLAMVVAVNTVERWSSHAAVDQLGTADSPSEVAIELAETVVSNQ